jgi:hypothetical protein
MAIYNAWCDRVPVYVMLGNQLDATMRRPGAEWAHSVQDAAAMVRDFTKWDDTPMSLPHFAESAVRAYKIAMTPPMAPVVLVLNAELQERPLGTDVKLAIPKLAIPAPPQGDSGSVAELARLLLSDHHPVIVADRVARTTPRCSASSSSRGDAAGSVIDQGAHDFPARHPLNQSRRARDRGRRPRLVSRCPTLGVSSAPFNQLTRRRGRRPAGDEVRQHHDRRSLLRANYQDFQRLPRSISPLPPMPGATLPPLIEAVKRLITPIIADVREPWRGCGASSPALDRSSRGPSCVGCDPVSTAPLRGARRGRSGTRLGAGAAPVDGHGVCELRRAVSMDRRTGAAASAGRRAAVAPRSRTSGMGDCP